MPAPDERRPGATGPASRPASSGAVGSSAVSRSSAAATRGSPTAQPPATCSRGTDLTQLGQQHPCEPCKLSLHPAQVPLPGVPSPRTHDQRDGHGGRREPGRPATTTPRPGRCRRRQTLARNPPRMPPSPVLSEPPSPALFRLSASELSVGSGRRLVRAVGRLRGAGDRGRLRAVGRLGGAGDRWAAPGWEGTPSAYGSVRSRVGHPPRRRPHHRTGAAAETATRGRPRLATRVTLTGSMAHLRVSETNDRDDEHHHACSSSRLHLSG